MVLPQLPQQKDGEASVKGLHEIDTRPFQVFQQVQDIENNANKFNNAQAFLTGG